MKYFSENRCDVADVFINIDDQNKMSKFVAGNISLMESLYFSLKGERENALNSLRNAVKVNPDDQEYPFLIKFYYGVER